MIDIDPQTTHAVKPSTPFAAVLLGENALELTRVAAHDGKLIAGLRRVAAGAKTILPRQGTINIRIG
jgi:hypothetical protein